MTREVKVFRIEGLMLISHDRNPMWQKFRKEVIALKPEHAIEKVYSELGSAHKLRRKHIKITSVREISPEEVEDQRILSLLELKRFVKL